MEQGPFQHDKEESEKHKRWGLPAKGFKGHVATDGSPLGMKGKWGACGWSEVQLDYDEELGPLHGMYGSVEAELEVQRTIKTAELTAFFCLLKEVIGPIKVHVDNKGTVDGLWKTERKCIDPKAGDADLWTNCEELHLFTSKETLEVEHVKEHRTEKDKKEMLHFETFGIDGNKKADELAKTRAMLDEGFMAQTRAKTVQREREEVYASYGTQPAFIAWWRNGKRL